MKKFFTLVCALVAFANLSSAATVDDLEVLKHSYVLVCDELGARPGGGVLFGANHFLDVKGGTTATNKGSVDLSVAGGNDGYVTEEIAAKYGEDYAGPHLNFLRLKNQQDMLALKLTAKSKIIIFEQGNNKSGKDARIPRISTDAAQSNSLNAAPDENHPATVSGYRWEFTVDDDGLYYLGSYNGDMFVSFIIIEANEAPGTPTVKIGDQTFEGGLWFREVTAKANDMVEEGSTVKIPTVLTYTTDGTAPTVNSPKYTEPIKCYQNMTVKFQAYMDLVGNGNMSDIMEEDICDGADYDAAVSFSFDAPTITANGADVTITTPYAAQNGTNYYKLNGGQAAAGDAVTLTESATVEAYTQIANGSYGTFTSKSSSTDVYVLNPIKSDKTINVTGNAVVDEEATAAATDGSTIYKIENGAITADKADFFVKNLTFKALANADPSAAKYQVPEGQEAYIQMSNTNITFQVAAGDSVTVKVTCSQNSCKNLESESADDRRCYVNVSGTNYGGADLQENPDGNVIEFGLIGGSYATETDEEGNTTQVFTPADKIFTFQKYSGTGNIMISSIEFKVASGSEANVLNQTVNVNREVGQGYSVTNATVDFTEAKSFLGVDALTTDMLRIENPDGTLISDYAPFDGWFNGEGVAETWGSNTKVCVKFFQAIPDGSFEICDMNGADEVGKTYTVNWQLVNGEKAVRYAINVTFVPAQTVEMEVVDKGIIASVSYDSEEDSYVEKTATLTDEQVAAICAELGISALSEADVYGYNPTTKELVKNHAGFDGWRDANGDFHAWTGNAEAPACVKYTDGQTYLCYNINGCPAQTIKTFWAIANTTKAVLVEIDFTYTSAAAADVVLWENDGTHGAVSWNGEYRFGLDGTDGNNECIKTFPEDTWNKIKTETICMQYRPEGDSYQIRVTTGWWNVQWLGENQDIAPWNMAERIIDNGDGTFHIEVNFGDDPIVEALDEKHLLFTGSGYTPLKLYFPASSDAIQNVETTKAQTAAIYSLSGKRVDASYKGIVIINGKKVVLK